MEVCKTSTVAGTFFPGTAQDAPACSKTVTEAGPIVRLFGATAEGHSVCCHVHGFRPYLFLQAPPGFDPQHCLLLATKLNEALLADLRGNKDVT